jgi:8-oxo-dGTP diphosphatase
MADGTAQVVAGVLVRGDCVLVCQRPPGGHHPDKWEFPGGKVEAGESLKEALQRELREELGIEANIGNVLWRTEHQYSDRPPFALTFFLVSGYRGVITNRVFAALSWTPIPSLGQMDLLEGDRSFVAAIEKGRVGLR